MKKIKWIALCAALIVGLGVYQFLKEVGKPQETPRTSVVVAAVDIPENTLVTADMVMLKPVATEALLPNHLRDTASVIGMVLSSDVYAGEQIVTNRLVRMGETEQNSSLAYVVEPGMRAVTISVNAISGIANMVRPGNRVDIVMNYSDERPKENAQDPEDTESVPTSRLFLQDVPVLAVGSVLSRDGSAEYATITLQVTPEDAVKISFAEYTASIRLILRSPLDEALEPECAVDLDGILHEKGEKAQ